MIPHKVLNIRCYICTCLALFFIFVFIRLLEYQILQFHAFFMFNCHRSQDVNDIPNEYCYLSEMQNNS